MALESDNEVPSISNYSYDDYCDNDDDESSNVSKLLLSKKKHYKNELTSLTKKFYKILKMNFLVLLNPMINLFVI